MHNPVAEILAKGLHIEKYSDETVEEYGHRLLYSALASWVRVSLLGKSFTDLTLEKLEDSVDIMHIINRLAPIANALICGLPHHESWLHVDGVEVRAGYVVRQIIRNMILCQEISRLKNPRRLTISPKRELCFGNQTVIAGGVDWQDESNKLLNIGLGKWMLEVKTNNKLIDSMGIPDLSTELWLEQLVNNSIRTSIDFPDDWYIYQPNKNKSWKKNEYKEFFDGIFLVKNHLRDYGLIIKRTDNFQLIRLDQWFYKEKEIYRIMYALNKKYGTPSCFRAYDHKDYLIVCFRTGIPLAEERILLLSSWPYRHILDKYYRVIPSFLWPGLMKVFEHLGIKWVVEKQNNREMF